jgi:hypothetical protein
MSTPRRTPDGTRPAEIPSYIEARERADRRQHLHARLLLLVFLLHGVYFIVPVLPFAQTRALVPVLAVLPPLFAVTFLLLLFLAVRRRWQWRRTASQFVPIPPGEDLT